MIYTFKLNTNNLSKTMDIIKDYCEKKNIEISYFDIKEIATKINESSYREFDKVQANSEDGAWDKVDVDDVIEDLEITDIDYSDEIEAEERAKAKYEAMQEDRAMEEYYERKYGN